MLSLGAAIADSPVVLDGGLGTLLEARGNDLRSALWSARLLIEAPEEIRSAHAEYFRAGARVAITSSYQLSYDGAGVNALTREEIDDLLARSIRLADQVRQEAGLARAAWIAASVGPYGASRADGSEYTGDYGKSVADLRGWHRRRVGKLVDAGPDVLAVETIPSLAEVEAVVAELDGLGIPAWISMTTEGDRLPTGEPVAEAFAIAAASPAVIAVGVNCCAVADVAPALRAARTVTSLPLIAYPNSGEVWRADRRAWSGAPGAVAHAAPAWLDAGARLVGGCCRVGPAQIADLADVVARGGPAQGTLGASTAF